MADIVDQAQQQNDILIEHQLKARKPVLKPTGKCHNCEEELSGLQLFCDVDCRNSWEYRERRKGQV